MLSGLEKRQWMDILGVGQGVVTVPFRGGVRS